MSDRALAPLGHFDGGAHVMPVRVYWEDTDASGIVYYANYLRFIERARSDMLRVAGVDQHALLERDGLAFVVRRCEIDYLAPARLDDDLVVRTMIGETRGASMVMLQSIWRGAGELVRATIRLACLNRAGRPQRLPRGVTASLATLSPNFSAI